MLQSSTGLVLMLVLAMMVLAMVVLALVMVVLAMVVLVLVVFTCWCCKALLGWRRTGGEPRPRCAKLWIWFGDIWLFLFQNVWVYLIIGQILQLVKIFGVGHQLFFVPDRIFLMVGEENIQWWVRRWSWFTFFFLMTSRLLPLWALLWEEDLFIWHWVEDSV